MERSPVCNSYCNRRRINGTVAPLIICYQEVFFLTLLIEIYAGYGTPLLKFRGYHTHIDTTTLSTPSTSPLLSHKACPPWDSNQGHQRPQLTSIPTKISQTDMDPDQISPTDVGPRPIISSCRRISPLQCQNQSQLMWYPTKYLLQKLGIPRYPSIHEHLRSQTPSIFPNFSTNAAVPRIVSNQLRLKILRDRNL